VAEAATPARAASPARRERPAEALLGPALGAWLAVMGVLVAGGLAQTFLGAVHGLPELFFLREDLLAVGLIMLMLAGLLFVPAWRIAVPAALAGWRGAALLAGAAALAAWAGYGAVMARYALTTDEALALFDARILAAGRLAAPLAPQWREYAPAMLPLFGFELPGHAYWLSSYLPVNAAFLALAGKLGAQSLMAPAWAALAVAATFGVARRLWPERPAAAPIAALLLATAPQLLITAMTPYAMSAHLALNMAWLWLVLRGGKAGHGAAAGVAFLATGLHQLVFNPLFAAPFVAEMWLARRWKAAAWHTGAYAAIGLFWAAWPGLILARFGGPAVTPEAVQAHSLAPHVQALVAAAFTWDGLGLMAKNLVRFATWQSLLTLPLALAAFVPAVRAGGTLRALALAPAVTLAAMFVLLPYQGHGWGYRYLHGLEGAFALTAAWALSRPRAGAGAAVAEAAGPDPRPALVAAGVALTLAVLLPLRLWQAHRFVAPYAAAERAIQASPAEIVLVDDASLWFGVDLVRNDPWLARRPVAMEAAKLTPGQARALCARHAVAWFTPARAAALGVPHSAEGEPARGADGMEAACPAAPPHLIADNRVGSASAIHRPAATTPAPSPESSDPANFQRPAARTPR